MVVTLQIGQWSARKHDRKITDEVNNSHNAASDAGRYNKQLASKSFLEPIQKVVSKLRDYHYRHTLPWGENSERLLTTDMYEEYVKEVRNMKQEFEREVAVFIRKFDDVLLEAKVKLNGMFNPNDYPSHGELQNKFYVRTTFLPVPETDFRVTLSDEELETLRAGVELEFKTRTADATKDLWTRIYEQLTHMKDRLTSVTKDEKTGQDKPAVFRDSLFDNLKELVDVLPKLNITKDPAIEDACTQLSGLLVDPDLVRNHANVRAAKADEVGDMLNKFNSFFN
jgi:hypothetical protein